jgi:hypothetical protein
MYPLEDLRGKDTEGMFYVEEHGEQFNAWLSGEHLEKEVIARYLLIVEEDYGNEI